MIRFLLFGFLFTTIAFRSNAQILQDSVGLGMIKQGIQAIYNHEFSRADQVISTVKQRYPQHPVTPLLQAFYMYWKYLPIQENKAYIPQYLQYLNACVTATEKVYGSKSEHPEAVFFKMAARGFTALMYNYQKEYFKAVGEAKKAYKDLVAGMKLTEQNPDFLFPTGVYNYYVIAYPESTPLIKPLMFFFKNGDKIKGIQQLEQGSQKGIITLAESCYYLSQIYLEFENQPQKALPYTSKLRKLYPQNPIYRMKYIENLIATKQWEIARKETQTLHKYVHTIYKTGTALFDGIQAEHLADYALAEKKYTTVIQYPIDQQYTKEYHAMAYLGLARLAHKAQQSKIAKQYAKKSQEIASYKATIVEAKSYE